MRLIDADALLDSLRIQMFDDDYDITSLISDIENAPTIDAVPVVRCQDCQFYDTNYPNGTTFYNDFFCKLNRTFNPPSHFCALGIRGRNDAIS